MTPKTNGGINTQKLQGEYTPLYIGVQPFSAKKICDRTARKWLLRQRKPTHRANGKRKEYFLMLVFDVDIRNIL